MPQAIKELREEWHSDEIAIQYLLNRGYEITENYYWIKPYSEFKPTEKELRAIEYLVQEYYWGGLIEQ